MTDAAAGWANVSFDTLAANIRANVLAGHRQVVPLPANKQTYLLLGGGPSLTASEDEIRRLRSAGAPLLCTNGTYNWCVERGIQPSALIVVDARPHNVRFIGSSQPDCCYFLASQCDPSLFDAAPTEQTWMWHNVASRAVVDELDKCYGDGMWYPVYGGNSVVLRSLFLFKMLGCRNFRVYGFDSCLASGAHHAYPQPENDDDLPVTVSVRGRQFTCHPWMLRQAHDFVEQMRRHGAGLRLHIAGDGLIAHLWTMDL